MKSHRWYPLWVAILVFVVITWLLFNPTHVPGSGHVSYPMDDTFIHMAIAKHFVNDGHWGVSNDGFSTATSSPLWTLLLALVYRITGINDWVPLALNVGFSIGVIVLAYFLLRDKLRPFILLIALVFLILCGPLPIICLVGMEHSLQTLLTLAIVWAALAILLNDETKPLPVIGLCVLAALLPVTRYESLFLVGGICLAFLFSKKWPLSFILGFSSLTLVAAYGFISLRQGWHFLPSPLLLKGNSPGMSASAMMDFIVYALWHFYYGATLNPMIMLVAIYLWYAGSGDQHRRTTYTLLIVSIAYCLHMLFAGIGSYYRYEAYLIVLMCVILADWLGDIPAHIKPLFTRTKALNIGGLIFLVLLLLVPQFARTGLAMFRHTGAVMNIYEQQVQMARFVKTYYDGRTIAANDIGAINFYADIYLLDLAGLGTYEVTELERHKALNSTAIATLAEQHDVDAIMIYNNWFIGQIPEHWTEVGSWSIGKAISAAQETVSFYATSAEQEEELIANLQDFSQKLPSTVKQAGLYTE